LPVDEHTSAARTERLARPGGVRADVAHYASCGHEGATIAR
jgi:hypothetical protein